MNDVENKSPLDSGLSEEKNGLMKWYTLHVNSGMEEYVKRQITQSNLEDFLRKQSMIKEVKYSEIYEKSKEKGIFEEVIALGNLTPGGEKLPKSKAVIPGYMFVKMIMCEESYVFVNQIDKVIGFLGEKNKPRAVNPKEVEKVLKAISDKNNLENIPNFDIGDKVQILDGPLTSMNGIITSIDPQNKSASISVNIFGSPTSVELGLNNVKKT